ncbi:MAG: APC family permease [Pseudomonadota bacterium]
MSAPGLARSIGLPSATFIVIGYVVGATIFILPGSLAPDVGPAVFIAYLLAALPAIIAGFVMAQLGSALPVCGSIFVLLREALSPHAGFVYQWIMLSMGAVVIPLIAYGFADFLDVFVPGLDARTVAAALVLLFIALNWMGLKVAATAQNIMVVSFLAALAVFGVGGIIAGDPGNLQPLFPKGYSALTIAAVTAYFSYAGVFVIAEIAGEVRDPGRNLPRAILLAFIVIIFLYAVVPLALTMLIDWREIRGDPVAVVTASTLFLPKPLVMAVGLAALFAAATTINSVLMGLSRDLFQGANYGLFSARFASVNKRTGTPANAVVLVGLLSLIGVAIGGAITSYAQLALIGLMVIQIMTGIALIKLPTALPDAYRGSAFRLSIGSLRVIAAVYIALSAFFLITLAREKPTLLIIGLAYLLAGAVYQLVRSTLTRADSLPNRDPR